LKALARIPSIPTITHGSGQTDASVAAPVTGPWQGSTLRELEGLEFSALGVAADAGGAFVAEVPAGSAAFAAGLRQGDFIQAVNGRAVRGVKEFLEAVNAVSEGANLKLEIVRNQQRMLLDTTHRDRTP